MRVEGANDYVLLEQITLTKSMRSKVSILFDNGSHMTQNLHLYSSIHFLSNEWYLTVVIPR
jgi:hypothetical protein